MYYVDEKRYHKDIFIPSEFIKQSLELAKNKHMFSKHVMQHLFKDNRVKKYNATFNRTLQVLRNFEKNPVEPFEVYACNKHVTKAVFKTFYSKNKDIIFVLTNEKVVTYYINNKNDNHKTLNKDLYEKAGEKDV